MKQIRGYDKNQVLIGTLLGDGCLIVSSQKNRKASLRIKHKYENADYIFWLKQYLNTFSNKDPIIRTEHGYKKYKNNIYIVLHIPTSKKLYYMWKRFYKINSKNKSIYTAGIKVIKQNIVNSIDKLALATWYMDDGSLSIRKTKDTNNISGLRIELATQCFTKHENQLLIDMFHKKFGLESFLIRRHRSNHKDQDYFLYAIAFNTINTLKFIKIVYPYVAQVSSMRYKLSIPIDYISKNLAIQNELNIYHKYEISNNALLDNDIVQSSLKNEVI